MASKITKIEAFRVPPRWLFVRVETSEGIVGWGESTLEGHTEAIEGAMIDLTERFVGVDPNNIEDIWQTAYMGRFYRGGPVLMSALSGLNIALWDIKGKKLGVPVWQLLGGKVRDRVKVYGWIGGDNPSDVVSAALERKKQGFTAVKMNGTEPLLPTQSEEIADLSNAVSTPIALGERLYTRHDFRPYLERRAIDIAQPDVAHCGGISELHRIASLTATYDVALAPHCPLGPIALAACLQVAISAPNFVIQEVSWGMHYNTTTEEEPIGNADLHTYMSNPEVFHIENGHMNILTNPGIGIEINEERVRKAAKYHTENMPAWRNPLWRGEDGSLREW
ncbi:hypothetical protein PQX77_010284 [Marasmius sp. AFHP31]|nr:hypothetical protein PQX77_010284 [Marasmius sp. AFHP31]